MRSVIRHLLVLTGLGLALAACGHRDQRLVDQYFNAVNSKDNQTLGSFAAVGFDKKVDRWRIATVLGLALSASFPVPMRERPARRISLVAHCSKPATLSCSGARA